EVSDKVAEIARFVPDQPVKLTTPAAETISDDVVWDLTRQMARASGLVVDDDKREVYEKGKDGGRGPRIDLGPRVPRGQPATEANLWAAQRELARPLGLLADEEKRALFTRKPRPGVEHTLAIPGISFVLSSAVSSNYGSMFIVLEPFAKRHGK